MKRYLFVLRHPIHNGAIAQEMLDIILTTAAFDQTVSLLLLDDAIFQLKTQQYPDILSMKDTAALFNALELYGINTIYVETESLQERGLSTEDLILPVSLIARHTIVDLMLQFDIIFPG